VERDDCSDTVLFTEAQQVHAIRSARTGEEKKQVKILFTDIKLCTASKLLKVAESFGGSALPRKIILNVLALISDRMLIKQVNVLLVADKSGAFVFPFFSWIMPGCAYIL
jgi:hypothetical protein